MFIRVKTADGELNIAVSQIETFQPTADKGSQIELLSGAQIISTDSCRVLRKLITEARSGSAAEGDA